MSANANTPATAAWTRLAAWMADPAWRPSDRATRRAQDALIDTVACMVAGVGLPAAVAVRRAVGGWGTGPASLVGGGRASAPLAALVNGTAAHALDFDDHDAPTLAHPSAVLVPALLAEGEARGATAGQVLRAYIAGLEVMDRLGEILNPGHYEIGWHSTVTLGSVAAAGAVAVLRGLDGAGVMTALSLGATMAGGLKAQFGSGAKPFHAGWAAHNGVVAAALAAEGLTAVPDALAGTWGFTGIFGADAAASGARLPPLPPPLAIEQHGLWVKAYPCCSYMGRPLDAILALRAEGRVTAGTVAAIRVSMSDRQIGVVRYALPANGDEARFSIPWCLAVALAEGSVAPRHFAPAALADAGLRDLASRIVLQPFAEPLPLPGVSTEDYDRLEIALAGGKTLDVLARTVRGSPDNPLSRAELFAKLGTCGEGQMAAERVERLEGLLEGFTGTAPVAPLMDLLRGAS